MGLRPTSRGLKMGYAEQARRASRLLPSMVLLESARESNGESGARYPALLPSSTHSRFFIGPALRALRAPEVSDGAS